MAQLSKNAIDKAGRHLAKKEWKSEEDKKRADETVDSYRSRHLAPLTDFTMQLQNWLSNYSEQYYIAQRLKRKPQIIRKLRRLSIRLTQLQDIGGARVVVKQNSSVDEVASIIRKQAIESQASIEKINDYRIFGRDESGYRAMHMIIRYNDVDIELQLRSEAQHYWAEQIERTSVIYGHHLKEQDGDPAVIEYFHVLSDIFHELECGREPSSAQKLELDEIREKAEHVIRQSNRNVFQSEVNEDVVKQMAARQSGSKHGITNWLIVFDWNSGSFVQWEPVDRNPEYAVLAYSLLEEDYPAENGFEVVMVGSSDPAMITHTHSHYFGIASYESVLATLEGSVVGLSRRVAVGISERKVLQTLIRRKSWSKSNAISKKTLNNHFCKNVIGLEESIENLLRQGYMAATGKRGDAVYLNIQAKAEIEASI